MKNIEMTSAEILERLARQNHMTIPRSNKFLSRCLENWLQKDAPVIEPNELFILCCERAGMNGYNAFMRAVVTWLKEKQYLPPKFKKFLDLREHEEWVQSLRHIIRNKFPEYEI